MKRAELCPVCFGSGKWKSNKCHGCEGKGWVEVGRDMNLPIPPWPIPHSRPYPNPYDPPYPGPGPRPIWEWSNR